MKLLKYGTLWNLFLNVDAFSFPFDAGVYTNRDNNQKVTITDKDNLLIAKLVHFKSYERFRVGIDETPGLTAFSCPYIQCDVRETKKSWWQIWITEREGNKMKVMEWWYMQKKIRHRTRNSV